MEAVIGTDTGESYQIELDEQQVQALTGLQIGDEVDGSVLGLNGYTLRITGGSDTEGFPMRPSVDGTGRKRLLLTEGTGAQDLEDGERRRKSVRGNTVSGQLSQVNMSVAEEGDTGIPALLGEEPDEEAEEVDAADDGEETAEADEEDEDESDEKAETGGESGEEDDSGDEADDADADDEADEETEDDQEDA